MMLVQVDILAVFVRLFLKNLPVCFLEVAARTLVDYWWCFLAFYSEEATLYLW